MRYRIMRWVAVGAALLGSSLAHAHGGASIEFDTCVVEFGKYRMHFTAYQQATGGEEHCWDLPAPGRTNLVFDFTDTEMRSKPVELRVVETGEGGEIAVGGPIKTIAQVSTKVYPQGTVLLGVGVRGRKALHGRPDHERRPATGAESAHSGRPKSGYKPLCPDRVRDHGHRGRDLSCSETAAESHGDRLGTGWTLSPIMVCSSPS